ncbi:23S rRNA (adenine(2503)-C(2))-methyltransferase RlmN [Thermodesulfobacteriota bacterium]
MSSKKIDLKNLTLDQITDFVTTLGLTSYRAKQIFSWLYRSGTTDFSQMTDISKDVRHLLDQKAFLSRLTIDSREESSDGTIKFGFRLADNKLIETVLIPEEERYTLCLSSQVGCAMGCSFCLTGTMGFTRNLSPSEMVNQVLAVQEFLDQTHPSSSVNPGRISNIVFMGMGEPLNNLENLITAIHILAEQRGLNFSERRITVSTCGIVPKIQELGRRTNVNLAISLHSVSDTVRNEIMPVNRTYPVVSLLEACRQFPLPKRRRIMIEYILIRDVNDGLTDAGELANKLQGIRCKINLLPYNETSDKSLLRRPSKERILAFQKELWKAGYTVIVRNSRGGDISAACGQLAGKSAVVNGE